MYCNNSIELFLNFILLKNVHEILNILKIDAFFKLLSILLNFPSISQDFKFVKKKFYFFNKKNADKMRYFVFLKYFLNQLK